MSINADILSIWFSPTLDFLSLVSVNVWYLKYSLRTWLYESIFVVNKEEKTRVHECLTSVVGKLQQNWLLDGEGHRINTGDHESDWMKKNIVVDIYILYYSKLSGCKMFKIFFFKILPSFSHKLEIIIIVEKWEFMFHRINVTFLENRLVNFSAVNPHLEVLSLYIMYFKLNIFAFFELLCSQCVCTCRHLSFSSFVFCSCM